MSCAGAASGGILFSVANGGQSGLRGDFIFECNPNTLFAGGADLGLIRGDDINGFSENASISIGAMSDFLLCFSVDRATEEKVRDLRKRAQWLKRYAEDKPYLASMLNTAANKLEAEARALEAELTPGEMRLGENT